jgi:hypothetical protein
MKAKKGSAMVNLAQGSIAMAGGTLLLVCGVYWIVDPD